LKIFDTHIHFFADESSYNDLVESLLDYSAKFNVERMAIIGSLTTNYLVERAIKEHPDKFVGIARLDMDNQDPSVVEMYHRAGFKALKILLTDKDYDHRDYFPFYEIAQEKEMVILFHTGIIGGAYDYLLQDISSLSAEAEKSILERLKGKSSARMRSIFLDTIANSFPDLKIIGAHLGWPEYALSCGIARWRRNVFFDISGGEVVRRQILEGGYIAKDVSPNKLLFGTDSAFEKMPREIAGWYDALKSIGLRESDIEKIFYLNAAEIFGVEKEC